METILLQISRQITSWYGAWEMAGLILCFFVVWLIGFCFQSGRLFRDIKRAVLGLRVKPRSLEPIPGPIPSGSPVVLRLGEGDFRTVGGQFYRLRGDRPDDAMDRLAI